MKKSMTALRFALFATCCLAKGLAAQGITYGSLAVANQSGTFVTSSPVAISFQATGPTPYTMPLQAEITGSSGIVASTGAYINYSSTDTGVSFNPPQCQVTSASPGCSTTVSISTASAVSVVVQVVGAVLGNQPGYSSITVNGTPNTTPTYGEIVLGAQSGNNVPNGMKAPLFVNWNGPGQNDTVTVSLSIAGSGISFYSFPAGNNTSFTTSTTQTCTLSYSGATGANTLGCGFGLVGQAASGTVTVSATASATSGHQYDIASLTLGAVPQAAAVRSVTFTNNSSTTLYVGITGGAAPAYISPTTPAIPPGTPSANIEPGAGSLCGPSNPLAACPIGSTCLQGGATPGSKTPFYCFYDQPALAPTSYQLGAGGGSTTFDISGSSLSPGGVIWSGNFYGRTGCDAKTGVCVNATCAGANQGLACGPGTGPSPGVNTLAELTFQSSTDFYDVSIINGANFSVQFGPTSVAVSTSSAYSCGTAGSTAAQDGGFSQGGLPAAPWTMNPTSASFPPGQTITGSAASYFQLVSQSGTATPCTSSSTCTSAPNTACGFRMSDVVTGNFNFASRYCGAPVAVLTADAIWGLNSSSSNTAPFAFTTNWPNGLTPPGTVSVGDLQLCISNTYSAYVNNGSGSAFPIQPIVLACGGVMWGATEIPGPQQNPKGNVGQNLTQPTQPVLTANANWLSYVLPTILWLKQACPTCYTYPFDDMTSTFTCPASSSGSTMSYSVTFGDLSPTPSQ